MAAEPRVGAQRPLEIDEGAAAERAERRDARGLRRHVHVHAVGVGRDHRQADAVDGEAVAVRELGRELRC